MEENRDKSVERVQNKNLKKDAGPGRPPGQRNYATIYRDALIKLAKLNGKTVDELEDEIVSAGILLARKGDYRYYKDTLDRIHGTPTNKTDITSDGKSIVLMPSEVINKINDNTAPEAIRGNQ